MEDEDVARLGKMGITASVQPVHIIDDIEIGSRILGERCSLLYRFASLLDTGAVLAFGSDAPVADPNPFLGIHSALYRQKPSNMTNGLWYEDESISLEQALYAYTMGPAIAAGWQDDIGSIEVGKRADIITLDRDLFEIVDSQIFGDEVSGTKVDMTLFDGVITYSNL